MSTTAPQVIGNNPFTWAFDNKDQPMGGMMDNIAILAAPASTGRAPEPLDRYRSEMEKADRRLLPLRITEVVDGRNRDLGDDYYFQQLPEPNDQIVVRNRHGTYDIMRVLYPVGENETTVFVRWVARR
jgi:hypothetical protein